MKSLAGVASFASLFGHAERAQESQPSKGRIKAVAFDGFVIFDPSEVEKRVKEKVPDRGAELASLWRNRQFEYCWLRTAGAQYADFWRVTEDALTYAARALKIPLNGAQRDSLMDAYRNLPIWPDVRQGLTEFRRRGIRMAMLSNFTAEMLDVNLKAAGLSEFFEPHLTTDRVNAYKPSPQAYQMGLDGFKLPKSAIAFAASAAWDAAGASWFGYPTVWVNRGGVAPEELQAQPNVIAKDLSGFQNFIES